jgi:hypothetical protein
MEWNLCTLDRSVTPSVKGRWRFPSKEQALTAACDLIDRRSLVTVLYIETTDENQRIELSDIEKWCRDRSAQHH